MDLISYSKAAKAYKLAATKVQRYSSAEAGRPDIATLSDGDEWFNETTGKRMVVVCGMYVDMSCSMVEKVTPIDEADVVITLVAEQLVVNVLEGYYTENAKVYFNGTKLNKGIEYETTNKNTITLLFDATIVQAGDTVSIVSSRSYTVASSYGKDVSDSRYARPYNQEGEPVGMKVGDTWYKPSTGKNYKYINDGASNMWIGIDYVPPVVDFDISGMVVQVQSKLITEQVSITSTANVDVKVSPDFYFSFTPKYDNSYLKITIRWFGEMVNAWDCVHNILRDGERVNNTGTGNTGLSLPTQSYGGATNDDSTPEILDIITLDKSGTLKGVSTTFELVVQTLAARAIHTNRCAGTGTYHETGVSEIIIEEIAQ